MLAENVVRLNSTRVYDQIEKYLTTLGYNSEQTKVAYKHDIELFFGIIKKKEIEYLTEEDVQLTYDDFEDFIEYMHSKVDKQGNRVYVNKTINRKVASVKGLIKYLAAKKLVKDISYLPLIKSLPETKNHHGVLEASEVFRLAELALEERNKGEIKRLLILFGLDTCVRKAALLNLKWTDFIEKEDVVIVKGIDKGNKDFRESISKDFYRELLTIKGESDRVFEIGIDAVDKMFKRLVKKMNIPEERNIVFHSIKKAGVQFRYRVTGDILEAQRAAKHSRLDTTRIYLEEEDYGALGAVSSNGKVNMDGYKEVSHEILLAAIGKLKKDQQFILNMKIMEVLKEK
ncbi:site-specific integrase [Bacillus sp. AG4(2022)]|uniref:tyrosine-type recombinase/integrase n=1 Tax=Bacillus sp. AG4(2022) TaxID=2962594 RepID=UPI002881F086|nr:site-specific integrase [Bacillus sp. AG4(2022)]MDT0160392.1 tyrosine-type recombinase/integrase [Bacillus sp. AG4(2022)]